jgi:hypothetical protein
METRHEHIAVDGASVPSIGGTTMKVVELVVEQRAYVGVPKSCTSSILI